MPTVNRTFRLGNHVWIASCLHDINQASFRFPTEGHNDANQPREVRASAALALLGTKPLRKGLDQPLATLRTH